jgi:hypothetical protein
MGSRLVFAEARIGVYCVKCQVAEVGQGHRGSITSLIAGIWLYLILSEQGAYWHGGDEIGHESIPV